MEATLPRSKEKLVRKFKRKAFVIRSMADIQDRTASGYELKRVLNATDLVMLGVGCTVGAGIMVLTGLAARDTAGPAVVVSYAIAGFAALLSSLCYAEFAADIPVAGGAFNYIGMTFGEFFAWVAACDLILEYTLSAAAIAKGFTAYMASLCNADLQKVRLQVGVIMLDFPAFGAVVVLSLVLMRSTRESALLNAIMVVLHLVLILFVMCAGFPFSDTSNYEPFLPYGVRGIFAGAAVVFFSFIGFDTVATAAEEAIDPGRSLPIGIVGSLGITTLLYVLMCLVITGMQHYDQIDKDAPFSVAFARVGLDWAGKVVSVGALVGIVTALLGSILGQARIYVTLGRQYLVSPWLAKVHEKTGTPINATFLTMCTAGMLALLFDIELLAKMVSIGTLVVFTMVAAGVLFRRYYIRGEGDPLQPLLYRLLALVVTSVGVSVTYTLNVHFAAPLTFLGCWALTTASFHLLHVRYVPPLFRCPFSPWLPSLGMLCCLHLIGSLGWPAYARWGVWFTAGTCVYLFYGIHNSQHEGKARQSQGIGVFHRSPEEGFDAALAIGVDDEEFGKGDGGIREGTELARLNQPSHQADGPAEKYAQSNGTRQGWFRAGGYSGLQGADDKEYKTALSSGDQSRGIGVHAHSGTHTQGEEEGDGGEIEPAAPLVGGRQYQLQQQQHLHRQQQHQEQQPEVLEQQHRHQQRQHQLGRVSAQGTGPTLQYPGTSQPSLAGSLHTLKAGHREESQERRGGTHTQGGVFVGGLGRTQGDSNRRTAESDRQQLLGKGARSS